MPLSLHYRLALPFAAVAVTATAVVTLYGLSQARRWVADHLREDAVHTAKLIQRAEYATNPALLRVAAELTHVEAITFRTDGEIVASTFTDEVPAEVLEIVRGYSVSAAASPDTPGETDSAVLREESCGEMCFVAYHGVSGERDLVIAVIAGRETTDPLFEAAVETIWLSAVVGLLLIVGASHVLGRRITAPIHRLVDFTHGVSPESTGMRADESDDDIGRLGAAFNSMLDRLAESKLALVRSEKLALAGLMAARVAHDVRNPLSSIKMRSQLLRSQMPPGSEHAQMLTAVLRDIDQLDSVVRDLLETARPEALTLEPVRIADVVKQSIEPFQAQLAHRRISLVLALDESAPKVSLDAGRFHRALANVLTNAADATRADGTITVTTRVQGIKQIVEIADDGVGLDPAVVGRVFDPFVSATPGGVGLGLVNARAVVESHGGRIVVEPREPRGTLVTITVPTRDPEADVNEATHG